jgi:transglutaminase/protease-like cytokinesis protein 3
MKVLASIMLVLFYFSSLAQRERLQVTRADIKYSAEVASPQALCYKITSPYKTDLQKVRAIVQWIAENISYNVRPYYSNQQSPFLLYYNEANDTGALKSLSERVAEGVLMRRVAFCDGYSRLFKTLCDYAGIKAEVILGYARTGMERGNDKFRSNHTWNAVYIDSTWKLLDVTWASGYATFGGDYVPHYNDYYFLTPPQDFVHDHYPEDLQWTLLSSPPVLKEFNHTPFKSQAFVLHKIVSYKPSTGIIEASVGDTLTFELETEELEKKLWIADTPYMDSSLIASAATSDTAKPRYTINGNKVIYSYPVTSTTVDWLNIVFNNDVIMRYKLNIRKNDVAAK